MEEESTGSGRWRSDHLFHLLVENVREYAIFLMNMEGRITTWNPGAKRLLGWDAEEAIGKRVDLIFTEDDRQAEIAEQEMSHAATHGRAEDTRWHVRKDGERFWANGIMTAVENESDELVGFAKIIRDRTEEKKHEEALERSNRNLEAFARHVAHEMRSPLMGMRLMIRSLLRKHGDDLDEETFAMAREMEGAIGDLDRFTEDLLSYARLGGPSEPTGERVESDRILKEALADLRALREKRGADVDVGDLPVVWANPTQLRHLLRNLISNAIEHNDADVPRVWIEAEEEKNAWIFRIRDNGPGIPEEKREQIFEVFRQGSEDKSGVGVGLTLCKRIVKAHGGRIWFQPAPKGGSIFFFALPKDLETSNEAT